MRTQAQGIRLKGLRLRFQELRVEGFRFEAASTGIPPKRVKGSKCIVQQHFRQDWDLAILLASVRITGYTADVMGTL